MSQIKSDVALVTEYRLRAVVCREEAERCWGLLRDDYLWTAETLELLANAHEVIPILATISAPDKENPATGGKVDLVGRYWKSMVRNRQIEDEIKVSSLQRIDLSRDLLKRTSRYWLWASLGSGTDGADDETG